MIGTQTHVQTADGRVLANGTGYLTDAGMTGPIGSVIGMKTEVILQRFLTQMPVPFKVASQDIQLQGVVVSLNEAGRCREMAAIQAPLK